VPLDLVAREQVDPVVDVDAERDGQGDEVRKFTRACRTAAAPTIHRDADHQDAEHEPHPPRRKVSATRRIATPSSAATVAMGPSWVIELSIPAEDRRLARRAQRAAVLEADLLGDRGHLDLDASVPHGHPLRA